MGLLFMRPNTLLMEIFNYKYRKNTYKTIAREMNVKYTSYQNKAPTSLSRQPLRYYTESECMNSGWCRHYARNDDIVLDRSTMESIISTIRSYIYIFIYNQSNILQ
jgi:hypothetical protein